ncbi:MAG: LysR family transcriptional regulator [Nevskia sp.]|nr:LysR family transcriptional regulator [Nevskia sp.]
MNDSANPRRDLNLFRIFHAVHGSGSLTQAAAQLHLTQPAVSNALSRLRLQFDDPLFVRDGRRMVPTPRANLIAPQVAAALDALDQVLSGEQRFVPARADRRCTIGLRELLEFSLLPDLYGELQRDAPGIKLHSSRIDRRRLERMLASGVFDLAIDVRLPVGEDIRHRLLFREELCLAVRAGHPFTRRKPSVDDWLAARHVVVASKPGGPVLEDLALERRDLRRQIAVRCQHYYAACRMVGASDLVLMLPRHYASQLSQSLALQLLPPPMHTPALEILLYWHRNTERDAGIVWIRERIVALTQARYAERADRKHAATAAVAKRARR